MSGPSTDRVRPEWTTAANLFTLGRVLLLPAIAVLVWVGGSTARWWALAIFVVAAASDTLDGWFARRTSGVSSWGKLADPLADKALILGTLAVLAVGSDVGWWVVLVIAVREIGITWWRTRLARRGVVVHASTWGKAKTVAQIGAIVLVLLPGLPDLVVDVALWVAVAVTVVSGVEYLRANRTEPRAS